MRGLFRNEVGSMQEGPRVGELAPDFVLETHDGKERLGGAYAIVREKVLADDPAALQAEIVELADSGAADLVITSGGTGLSPRDRTPQATAALIDYEVPGIAEAIRAANR